MIFNSGFKMLAPVTGGAMFGWSTENGLPFPCNHWFFYLVLTLVQFVMISLHFVSFREHLWPLKRLLT
jgi:hypothetical protein